MSHFVLVDGNNVGFASMSSPTLSSGAKDTQGIFGSLRRVRNIFLDNPGAMVVILWDGRSWRKDVYPEYKANRETTDKMVADRQAYYDQKKDIIKGLNMLGVTQSSADNMEADDLAAILTDRAIKAGGKVSLYTADMDWLQLVGDKVEWIDTVHGKRCTIDNFAHTLGYTSPANFVEGKCVIGDRGDNVPGILGLGPVTLSNMFAIWPTLESLWTDLWDGHTATRKWTQRYGKTMPKALRELNVGVARATIDRNMMLMDLRTTKRPDPINFKYDRSKLQAEAFEVFCYENAFMSMVKQMDIFLKPFKDNKNVIR